MKIYNDAQMNTDALNKIQQILINIEEFIIDFDLDGFKGIKIVPDSLLHPDSDGLWRIKLYCYLKIKLRDT